MELIANHQIHDIIQSEKTIVNKSSNKFLQKIIKQQCHILSLLMQLKK